MTILLCSVILCQKFRQSTVGTIHLWSMIIRAEARKTQELGGSLGWGRNPWQAHRNPWRGSLTRQCTVKTISVKGGAPILRTQVLEQGPPWMQKSLVVMEVFGEKGNMGISFQRVPEEDVKELPRRTENIATTCKGGGCLSQMVAIIRHNQVQLQSVSYSLLRGWILFPHNSREIMVCQATGTLNVILTFGLLTFVEWRMARFSKGSQDNQYPLRRARVYVGKKMTVFVMVHTLVPKSFI